MEATNRVALVAGANKGIGCEIACQLGKLGMSVMVGARDERWGEEAGTLTRLTSSAL